MKNRWGIEVKRGMKVTARHPLGGAIQGTVVSIDRTSEFAKAYGPRVELDGFSVGVDDITGVQP